MKDFAKKFYFSKEWKEARAGYLNKVGGLCELCLRAGLVQVADVVHHRIALTPENITDPNITTNFDNLMALCHYHHALVHNNGQFLPKNEPIRRYTVDEYGNVTIREVNRRADSLKYTFPREKQNQNEQKSTEFTTRGPF